MNDTLHRDDNEETPAIIEHDSYIIPARLVKQFVAAMEPAPEPNHMEQLLKFLDLAKIQYDYEQFSCGDSRVSQVWFRTPQGWELVFTFDSETGKFSEMYLEA